MEQKTAPMTLFMAKMKIYEAYKTKQIDEEQANYFVDLLDEAQNKIFVYDNKLTNSYEDAFERIYDDCISKAHSKGIKGDSAELKAFAIYVSKTSAVHNHKQVMLEDIVGIKPEFPVESISKARGMNVIEEKFILLDYLKRNMAGNEEYIKAYKELESDILFTLTK